MFEPLEARQMFSVAGMVAIDNEYAATLHETDAYGTVVASLLGSATSAEMNDPAIPGAEMQSFGDNGVIIWTPSTGAHVIYGGIGAEYKQTAKETDAYGRNVQSVLGAPTSDEMNLAGVSGGRTNTFVWGSINWTPGTGAHVDYGGLGGLYNSMGGGTSWLGLQTSDESGPQNDRVVSYQNGTISWSPSGGAVAHSPTISAEYTATAHETDAYGTNVQAQLGSATSPVTGVPGVAGAAMQTFHDSGAIYWSPTTGAHVMYGYIGAEYKQLANETDPYGTIVQSIVGLPTSDEMNIPGVAGARENTFQGGSIEWSAGTGAHVVYGDPGYVYLNMGGAGSWLGMETSDESGPLNNRVVDFQNGYITWNPTNQAVVHNTSIAVNTRFGDEWVVTAGGTKDNVTVSQTGSLIVITADGTTSYAPLPAGGLFIYTRGGQDSVQIGSSVKVLTTVETIDGAQDSVFSQGTNVIAWADSNDRLGGSFVQKHFVDGFADGVSKAVGASVANPTDAGTTFTPSASLFGTGPVASDINQGSAGDCWLMADLASIANTNPSVILNTAVDMGDGTYAVEFHRNGAQVFERVNGQMPVGNFGGYDYCNPGPNGTIWGPVIEKAYVYFRSGANTYASINNEGGEYVSEPMQELGLSTVDVLPSDTTDNAMYSMFSYDLSHGISVAANIPPMPHGGLLIIHHCYSLFSVEQVNGVNEYTLRNPHGKWTYRSDETSTGYITLTFAQMVDNVGWMTQGTA